MAKKIVNPYNFVPFGKKLTEDDKVSKEKYYRGDVQNELLSGWIDVSTYIKKPIIIPDGAHVKTEKLPKRNGNGQQVYKNGKPVTIDHKIYGFLKNYNPETDLEEYTISGSELRGMIRSAYEAATNSCVPFMLNDSKMSERVPLYAALNKRGLLNYDGQKWILYSTVKELEEVVVIPVYKGGDGRFCAENLDSVKKFRGNKNEDGSFKYHIIDCLDNIEKVLREREQLNLKSANELKDDRKKNLIYLLFLNKEGKKLNDVPTGKYVQDKGWLQYNVPVNTKQIYHVAYLEKDKPVKTWERSAPEKNIEAYGKLLSSLYRDGVEGANGSHQLTIAQNKECNSALIAALNNACKKHDLYVPVYYMDVTEDGNTQVYMSGSASGRIAQKRKWDEILDGHTPCNDKFCPACLLFGTIKNGGMKGHIRFTDAFPEKKDSVKPHLVTLPVLAGPRTSAYEFYLDKPVEDATYWNFDFYEKKNSDGYTEYCYLAEATPRGRKMYWHHSPEMRTESKTGMNGTFEYLDKNAGTFHSKIYFDQITQTQLDDLIWTITLGENKEESREWHKIGHGKPLGYGSVKLVVDGYTVRKFSVDSAGNASYRLERKNKSDMKMDELVYGVSSNIDINSDSVKSLLKICNADAINGLDVGYPQINGKIFSWFAENRTNAGRLQTLPNILDNNVALNIPDRNDRGNKGYQRNAGNSGYGGSRNGGHSRGGGNRGSHN